MTTTAPTADDIQALAERLAVAEATIARVKALAAWAAKPCHGEELDTTDGTLLYVGENAVWVRSDNDTAPTDGCWWKLDGTPAGVGPCSISEVLTASTDPDTDRTTSTHNFEALITADELNAALAGE